MVILNRNSIYSVISLIVLILGSCCILFLMKIEFLTFIILLIYIGAISVIFLFLIMMLNLNKQELKNKKKFILSTKYLIYNSILFKLIFFFFFFNKKFAVTINSFSFEYLKYNLDLNIFSNYLFKINNDIFLFSNLFTQKYFSFLIVGIILLFSMIGSIALCIRNNKYNLL